MFDIEKPRHMSELSAQNRTKITVYGETISMPSKTI